MAMPSVLVLVHGIVQGVGFRPFVYRTAVKHGLSGYVRNRRDSLVEILLKGEQESIESFLEDLKGEAPPAADIHRVEVYPAEEAAEEAIASSFTILGSSPEASASGSIIPADISICPECERELRDPRDRRFRYFFITCTNCGPRFTIIESTPYDRENTTMRLFPPCEECLREYRDHLDRRFHAQTVACPRCGPSVRLLDPDGRALRCDEPIEEAGKLISQGCIVAVKGNGGYHLAASTLVDEPLKRLRSVKERLQKPFALMARSLEAVKGFAEVSELEERLLTSPAHPIVLLRKSQGYYLSDLVAPGLDTVGVMLPYTGLHILLFDRVGDPAFVMTSANKADEPIIKDDDVAVKVLRGVVDYLLIHDRPIAHRCDDSVVKVVEGRVSYIRRSRGYAPKPIMIPSSGGDPTLALGAELNVTSCILFDGKAFLSQHIGDVETLETLGFLEEATRHLMRLVRCKPERIACDLHPRFNTTRLAEKLSEEFNIPLYRIQHHHAHAAKLMAEHGLDEVVCIVCDGFGYGLDGGAWGGEILYSNGPEFERLAHLEEHPMIGGDLATLHPLRMTASILYDAPGFQDWLQERAGNLPHGAAEAELILREAERRRGIATSSCGRILDAAAALLDVAYSRTYEGEPAMKLEAAAYGGKPIQGLNPIIEGNRILTKPLLEHLYESLGRERVRDLAYSAHIYLARGLALQAIREAERLQVRHIGFTGGVAYNRWIARELSRILEKNGYNLLLQKEAPCGDGGISLGQAYAASSLQ
jgi:hydrogenase maturation protein HypF